MIFVSPDYRAKTSRMGLAAEADVDGGSKWRRAAKNAGAG
jgi:hypothetical protein